MGSSKVTDTQWLNVAHRDGRGVADPGQDSPATVNWFEAMGFAAAMTALDGEIVYSLPSETEWEYAARAGRTSPYPFREDEISLRDLRVTVSGTDARRLQAVDQETLGSEPIDSHGLERVNPWGLEGIVDTEWEWVEDLFSEDFERLPTDGSPNLIIGRTAGERVSEFIRNFPGNISMRFPDYPHDQDRVLRGGQVEDPRSEGVEGRRTCEPRGYSSGGASHTFRLVARPR